MKKILSLVLTIAIIICAVPLGAFTFTASAVAKYTEGYYTYTVEGGEATIINTDSNIAGDITIPSTLGGYPVTCISGGFDERPDIISIIIPTSVVSMENTFYRVSITSINIPYSVKNIYRCFSECYDLAEINVDENNENYCSVDGVLFNKDKTELIRCPQAKRGTITIPDSVTNIASSAFSMCYFTEINVDKNNKNYCSLDGVLYDKDVTILIKYPSANKRAIYIIPDGVHTINTEAFSLGGRSLRRLWLPNSINNLETFWCGYPPIMVGTYLYGYEDFYQKETNYGLRFVVVQEKNEIYYDAPKNITVGETGIYSVALTYNDKIDSSESTKFDTIGFSNILLYDKNNKQVKYNTVKKGYPLIESEKYTIKLRVDYTEYSFVKKADTIFPDTSADGWYNDAVTYAVGAGIIGGYGNGKFGTSDSIQRQDFLVILARLEGVDLTKYSGKSQFPDVSRNSYYEAAVNWGAKNGIVTGYDNGKFGVGDKVTREQLVTFLYRYAKYKGLNVNCTTAQKNKVKNTYSDYKNVSAFAQDAIIWAVTKGVINGKTPTTIVPQGNAQRCEVAQIMYNIFKNNIF